MLTLTTLSHERWSFIFILCSPLRISTCRLCGDPITTTGEHQICTISCGHLFGYKCLLNWFEMNPTCPICNANIKFDEIKFIFWPNPTEEKSEKIETIQNESNKYENIIKKLDKRINDLEKELDEENQKLYKEKPETKLKIVEEVKISEVCIIHQRKVEDGSLLKTSNNYFTYTCKLNEHEYGINYCPFFDFKNYEKIELHEATIKDIDILENMISTASIDKHMKITDINANKIINNYSFDLPLWSCSFLNPNLLSCGTERGFFYIMDNRSESDVFKQQIKGPPINSISKFNDNLALLLSAQEIKCFELRMNAFIPINTNIKKGGFSLDKSNDTNLFTLLQRDQAHSRMLHCSFDETNFKLLKEVEIGHFTKIPRTCIRKINDTIYTCIPNEPTKDFKLLSHSPRGDIDIWEQWKDRWNFTSISLPISSVSIDKVGSIVLSTLSPTTLTIYELPLN